MKKGKTMTKKEALEVLGKAGDVLRVTVIVGEKTGLIVRGGALTEKQVKAVARAQMRKDGITEAMVRAYMYNVTPPGMAKEEGAEAWDASDKEAQAIDAAWGVLHSAGRAKIVYPPIIGGLGERVTAKARATGGGEA